MTRTVAFVSGYAYHDDVAQASRARERVVHA